MIAPKRIEIRWRDLAAAFFGGFLGPARQEAARRVEGALFPPEEGLSVLSVRSGFDLLLSALQLPPGSEILVSAVTIEDMTRIIREHGLVPVPVDLDMESLSLPTEAVEAAVTDRTRAILVAHVFGSRMPLADVAEVARAKGLLLIEDCAQAFDGSRYAGSEHSDVAMYSFGPIKTLTALGGGGPPGPVPRASGRHETDPRSVAVPESKGIPDTRREVRRGMPTADAPGLWRLRPRHARTAPGGLEGRRQGIPRA